MGNMRSLFGDCFEGGRRAQEGETWKRVDEIEESCGGAEGRETAEENGGGGCCGARDLVGEGGGERQSIFVVCDFDSL